MNGPIPRISLPFCPPFPVQDQKQDECRLLSTLHREDFVAEIEGGGLRVRKGAGKEDRPLGDKSRVRHLDPIASRMK